MITTDQIQKLRKETSSSIADCKKALEETAGDFEKALGVLKARGKVIAQKKSQRSADEGIIISYIHNNKKVGVLLDLRCETDFVARSSEFQNLGHELSLHITAMNPEYVSPNEVPQEFLEKNKAIFREEFLSQGKKEDMIEKMIEGKLQKYLKDLCLLNQQYIKNADQTILDLINEYIAKLGENILIKRFMRYEI